VIELSYQVTEAEFMEAGSKLAERKGTIRVLNASTVITVAIELAIGLYLLVLSRVMHDYGWATVGVIILGFAAAFPFIRRTRLRKTLRRSLQNSYRGAPFMHSPVQTRLDNAGIFMKYISGSSVNTWEGHQSSFETDNLIVVMQTTTHMRIFPKRAFTDEKLTEFRQLLAEHGLSLAPI